MQETQKDKTKWKLIATFVIFNSHFTKGNAHFIAIQVLKLLKCIPLSRHFAMTRIIKNNSIFFHRLGIFSDAG